MGNGKIGQKINRSSINKLPMTFLELSIDEMARKEAEEAAFNALPLIEQNKIKLAKLEQEWSALGSIREITFTVFLGEEDQANSFANDARKEGFDVSMTGGSGRHDYGLNATRLMEPVAENVTLWEEWFRTRISKVPDFLYEDCIDEVGAYFEGWSYPKRVSPSYLLKADSRPVKRQTPGSAKDRTRVLFGQTFCNFEASNGWSSKRDNSTSSSTFELVPSDFLKNARLNRPSNPEPTASAFSQWLYSLYANAFGNEQDRARGKAAEEFILAGRRKAYETTDPATMRKHFPDWRLKHNGLSAKQSDRPNYHRINDLLVGGEPLRVLPDLIYENKRTKDIIIVEIKHSQMDIPSNLWPNIWGQLWCYAQMQELRDSPNVTVIGEVWGDSYHARGQIQYVYLRASVRRDPRALAYDRFFRTLFDIYRGVG